MAGTIRVVVGEPLVAEPLTGSIDGESVRTAAASDGTAVGRLLRALTDLDTDAVMNTIKPHDPFSWQCAGRSALRTCCCVQSHGPK